MLKKVRKVGYGSFSPIFPGARVVPLHVMLSGCGFNREESPLYNWNGMERGTKDFSFFQWTISGRGALEYEGKHYDLGEKKSFILHAPHRHRYFLPSGSDHWEFLYFSLKGREAMSLWCNIEKLHGPVAELEEDSPFIKRLAEIYILGMKKGINSPFHASLLAYELLMLACRELLPRSKQYRTPEFMPKVLSFCLENIGKPISVDEMAAVAGLSRFHFSRLFTASQGMGPGAFLTDLRMRQALRLIQSEMLTIKEISEVCGFRDPSYFCRVFRETFDTSPERFRKGDELSSRLSTERPVKS